jgi:hypothetical protein
MAPAIIEFDPCGPFDVPLTSRRFIDNAALGTFWQKGPLSGLHSARGLYVFAVKGPGRGMRPLYVGRASRQRFGSECFNPANRDRLNHGLPRRGRLALFLVQYVHRGPGRANSRAIADLERELIALAKAKNPQQLLNIHGARPRFSVRINRVLNPGKGKRSVSATAFKEMIGL